MYSALEAEDKKVSPKTPRLMIAVCMGLEFVLILRL